MRSTSTCASTAGLRAAFLLCLVPAFAILVTACVPPKPDGTPKPLGGAQQLVLVITDGWEATEGELRTYRKDTAGWEAVAPPSPVAVGRSGSAWGVGLHAPQPGPAKREGDGRAPAGVFAIGTAFGYAGTANTAMPYAGMGRGDWCIDVSDSPLYNRIVDADVVGTDRIAGSTEPMRRDLHAEGDQRYRLGFVIAHNPNNVSGAGSCIFAHLWKAPGEATAGCTAMSDATMDQLLAWLSPARRPVFVLLPRREYQRLRLAWGLPEIERDE